MSARKSKNVVFNCPADLLARVDEISRANMMPRSEYTVLAIFKLVEYLESQRNAAFEAHSLTSDDEALARVLLDDFDDEDWAAEDDWNEQDDEQLGTGLNSLWSS